MTPTGSLSRGNWHRSVFSVAGFRRAGIFNTDLSSANQWFTTVQPLVSGVMAELWQAQFRPQFGAITVALLALFVASHKGVHIRVRTRQGTMSARTRPTMS